MRSGTIATAPPTPKTTFCDSSNGAFVAAIEHGFWMRLDEPIEEEHGRLGTRIHDHVVALLVADRHLHDRDLFGQTNRHRTRCEQRRGEDARAYRGDAAGIDVVDAQYGPRDKIEAE